MQSPTQAGDLFLDTCEAHQIWEADRRIVGFARCREVLLATREPARADHRAGQATALQQVSIRAAFGWPHHETAVRARHQITNVMHMQT
jgi:hypothetical protein